MKTILLIAVSLCMLVSCAKQAEKPAARTTTSPTQVAPSAAASATPPAPRETAPPLPVPPAAVVSQAVIEETVITAPATDVTASVAAAVTDAGAVTAAVASVVAPMTNEATTSNVVEQAAAPSGPQAIFDLAQQAVEPALLARHKIMLHKVNGQHIFGFETNSAPLSFALENLPAGNAPRTIIAAVRVVRPIRDAAPVMYGKPEDKQLAALSLNYEMKYCFWGYGADLPSMQVATPEWTVVAFSHDGTLGTLYLNGAKVRSVPMTLDTLKTPLLVGARSFVGNIGAVQVYDTALDDATIAALSAARRKAFETE